MSVLKIPREQKEQLIADIQAYFNEVLSETVGNMAAEAFLDFMLQRLGPLTYNLALADARKLVTDQLDRINDDLYSMERPLDVRRR